MSKAKPCPRPVDGEVCGRPKKKGKQTCQWHWLLRQSSDVQSAQALRRLAANTDGTGNDVRARVPATEWPEGERWCAGCQSFIPLFYCQGSRCKGCTLQSSHERRVEATYGITADDYDEIFRRQGRRCGICQNQPRTIRFAVDHDHKTSEPRGILCKRCNHDLLGGGHDSPAMLWRAIGYLLFPPAQTSQRPTHGDVVVALRAFLEAEEALTRRPAVEPQEPPF